MKELSLNILDVAENSVKAGAKNIRISIEETDETLSLDIVDDGCGMTEEVLRQVENPFFTTRTTRDVGLGIPLLKLAAEQTGGHFAITSKHESEYPKEHGTHTQAVFNKEHIDFTPLGDIVSTIITLVQGAKDIDFEFVHTQPEKEIDFDTKQIRQVIGDEIPLDNIEVLQWMRRYLEEEYRN